MPDVDMEGSTTQFATFLLTVLGCALVPVTLFRVMGWRAPWDMDEPERPSRAAPKKALRGVDMRAFETDKADAQGKEAARRPSLFSLGNVALVAGWCLLAFLVYFVYAHTAVHVGFDPYEILGVDRSATEADIKRVFRVLALRHHPDRNPDSREEAAAQMIRIQSAFNALTDPDARANWDKYGHPDGPGAFRMGIALPEWFLTKDRSRKPLVLAALLLGGITAPLAFLIYLIHRAADPVAPKEERVSPDTVKALLGPPPQPQGQGQAPAPAPGQGQQGGIQSQTTAAEMLDLLAMSPELLALRGPGKDRSQEVALVSELMKALAPFTPELRDRSNRPIPAHRAVALLAAFLLRRTDLVPKAYTETLRQTLSRMPPLLDAAFEVAALQRIMPFKYSFNTSLIAAAEFSQSLYAAVHPMFRQLTSVKLTGKPVECKVRVSQDLLQLPGCLDPAVIKGLEAAKILSASDLLALPRDRRAPALVAAGVSQEDASLALDMLEWLPRVVVDARLEPLNRAVGVVATYMTSCEIRVSIVRPRHFRQTAPVEAPAPGTRAAAAASPPEKIMAQIPHWPLGDREERWTALVSLDDANVCMARLDFLPSKAWAGAERAGARLAATALAEATEAAGDKSAPGYVPPEDGPLTPLLARAQSLVADKARDAAEGGGDVADIPGEVVILRFFAPPQAGRMRVTVRVLSQSWLGCDVAVPIVMEVQQNSPEVMEKLQEALRKEQEEMFEDEDQDPYEEYSESEGGEEAQDKGAGAGVGFTVAGAGEEEGEIAPSGEGGVQAGAGRGGMVRRRTKRGGRGGR